MEDRRPGKDWLGSGRKRERDFQAGQWLRVHLPRQETQVHSLVREDSTRRGATEPVGHHS